MNEAGPRDEPWMTLAIMLANEDVSAPNFVQCEWPSKKSLILLYASSGIYSRAIFCNKEICRTVSKALLKSKAMTCTYGHSVSMVLIECRSDMSAAVVEPVGLKANWSENDKSGGGCCKAE